MPRTDRASRVMAAPPERVWAALVDPEALLAWLPPGGMTGRFERFDARPGGTYRMVLTYSDASGAPGKASVDSDIVEARFVDIVPGERVVQAVDFVSDDPAYAGTMTMTWEVTAVDAGTRVDIVAEDVPDGISTEDHAAGLASSLTNLAAYVEQSPRCLGGKQPLGVAVPARQRTVATRDTRPHDPAGAPGPGAPKVARSWRLWLRRGWRVRPVPR